MFCKLKKWATKSIKSKSNKYLIVAFTICELSIAACFLLPKSNKLTKDSSVILNVLPIISAILFKRVKWMFL